MINSVEEHRQRGHERNRSVASGPAFSVPSLSGVGDLLAPAPSAPVCPSNDRTASASPAPAASLDLTGLIGRSVGTGQCVALVRAAQPSLGPTAFWQAGAPVQDNPSLAPGTPIATFDPSGRYANATNGSSHAAVYLGQDAHGVTVLDQWAGTAASVRTIPWDRPGSLAANTGAAFRVIKASA